MTLALLIMAVGGAWAQSSLNVVEFEVPADWQNNNSPVTAADLPGFKEVTLDEAMTWTGAPAEGYAILFYAFDGNKIYLVNYGYGGVMSNGTADFTKKTVFDNKSNGKFYYTAEITEWELKPDETGKNWILADMPASNIELQVEYYAESNLFLSKEALADKASIAVTAGELGVQFGEDGKSANTITEGTAMTVKYNGTKKVIGVKVEKKAVARPLAEAVAADLGKIAGADGNIYDTKADAEAANTTAVAMIAYVGSSTDHATYKHGLAIALSDDSSGSIWSTAKSTCEGKTAVTNAAWQLPSQNQWKAMFKAFGGNEGSYSGLNTAIGTAGGTALQEDAYYWASSEYDADNAWNVHPLNGGTNLYYYSKDYDFFKARACLAF